VSPPTFEEAAVTALKAYGRQMMAHFQNILFAAGASSAERAETMAVLIEKMAVFAADGNKLGVDSIVSQAASEAQEMKLELEGGGKVVLEVIGAALLDAASYFLPLLADVLVEKIFPESAIPPGEGGSP
jgi:hypothetical protein